MGSYFLMGMVTILQDEKSSGDGWHVMSIFNASALYA